MKLSEFKIGDKLEIIVQNNSESNIKPPQLVSQLVDIKDDLLYISIPLVYGEPFRFKRNSKIKIIIYREEKGIYSFTGEIVNMVQRNIIMYGVKPIGDVEKEQRRFHFRLQNTNKLILKSTERDLTETCYTKDISGGGTKVACKSDFNKNEKVICHINIEGEIVNATGEIVRKVKNFDTNNNEIGIKFIEITDINRNKIISYIFKEQRLLRKKGLI